MNLRTRLRSPLHLLAILILIAVPSCNTPSPAKQIMQPAEVHISQGEYTAAESLYHSIPDSDEDPDIALALADLYTIWQRPALGLRALENALSAGISHSEVITRELALLLQDQQWVETIESAQSHLLNDPGSSAALAALTSAYLQLNQCADARKASQKAWLASGSSTENALVYSILNEDTAVLCDASPEICSIAADCAGFCHTDIGVELIRRNRWSLASCVLERAVAKTPSSVEDHIWLGESLARIGQQQAAEGHFYTAVELDPTYPLGWLLLGTHALQVGEWETARAALLNAQQLDPENPAPCLSIAELKATQGLYNEVDTWIRAALERAANDIDIWKAAARIYLSRNLLHSDMPTWIAENTVLLDPEDAESHLLLGWAYMLKGENESALPEIESAIELDGSSGHAQYLRGVIMEQTGKYEEAEIAFTRAADLGYFP